MEKLFAKLESDGSLTIFKNPLVYNGQKIYNPKDQQLLSAGYKNYEPAEFDMETAKLSDYTVSYTEDEFTIYQHYNYVLNAVKAQQVYTEYAQDMMDSVVKDRNYDSIASTCSYFNSTNAKFAKEANVCIKYRDSVWVKCYELLGQVLAGKMEIPSKDDFLAMLPQFSWDMYDEKEQTDGSSTDQESQTNNNEL
nr:MAG TPA: hypothetical protein [Caudoviricetes sp.]